MTPLEWLKVCFCTKKNFDNHLESEISYIIPDGKGWYYLHDALAS